MNSKICKSISLIFLILLVSLDSMSQIRGRQWSREKRNLTTVHRYPGESWLQYATPEEAGYSSRLLQAAKDYYHMIDSAALLVIHDGAVLVSWGNVSKKYMCHSMRKSLLSSLYGIYVNEGFIDMDKTMAELNIDDDPPLWEEEKEAKVRDLIKARSGIYHEAAYESAAMKAERPPRGSHPPGTFWYYNNWDFNTLGTIFEHETGLGIFDAFEEHIAEPLDMQDFIKEEDTEYVFEPQYSIHPAYPFTMTARDLARFGYLYLRNGRWNGTQIVPEAWVEESTFPYSEGVPGVGGYGYMWWVDTNPYFNGLDIYFASGYRGHSIYVIPGADLVIVHRVDTYTPDDLVYPIQEFVLLDLILKARISEPPAQPVLIPTGVNGYEK
jgi:CubicO group peptidase (beta-lactamase class C family)